MNVVRSYIIAYSYAAKGLEVKGVHWAVGYTPAHKATPVEAIDFEIEKQQEKIAEHMANINTLRAARRELTKATLEDDPAFEHIKNRFMQTI